MESEEKLTNQPLITVVRHYIKPARQEDFEQWTENIRSVAKTFSGFQGLQTISPPPGSNEYISLFRFSSISELQAWMDSQERKVEVDKLVELSEKKAHLKHVEGIDFWFDSPDKTPMPTPPKWKMSLLTWIAVFPGVAVLSQLYKVLLSRASPLILTLMVTLTLVPLLTWIIMPNLVKLFKSWIFKSH